MQHKASIQHPSAPFVVNVLPAKPVIEILPPTPVKHEPDYPALITAGATVALVLATVVLAYLTWVLARATSKASVVATIEPNPAAMNFVDMHIVNEGNAAAFDVQIDFAPPLPDTDGQFDEIRFPSRISIFSAGQRMTSALCEARMIMDNSYVVTVSWLSKPKSRRRQSVVYDFDLSHMKAMSRLGEDPTIQTANELRKIRESIDKLASGRNRLRVDSYSEADRENEHARIRAHRDASQAGPTSAPTGMSEGDA